MSVLKIKDQNGQWTDVLSIKGEKGDNGQDYVLTENDKQEIAQDVAELVDIPVDDVQINGASVVQNGVANIPLGGNSQFGAVKGNTAYGINITNGEVHIASAESNLVKVGSTASKPITPNTQHESTFYGLAKASGDTTQSQSSNVVGTYTDDAKASIQSMLGVPSEDDVVTDVQINGTSVVTDGIAEIPIANSTNVGVAKFNGDSYGIAITSSGDVYGKPPTDAQIKAGTNIYKPITSSKQHIATFYGLAKASGDTTQSESNNAVGTYTDEAKASIQSMLGVANKADKLIITIGAIINSTNKIYQIDNTYTNIASALARGANVVINNDPEISPYVGMATIDNNPVLAFGTSTTFNGTAVLSGYLILQNNTAMRVDQYTTIPTATSQLTNDSLVGDVQIDGTSIVSSGVAEIPIANMTQVGLLKTALYNGFVISNTGNFAVDWADLASIKTGVVGYKALNVGNQHRATFYGLAKAAGDTTQSSSSNAVGTYTTEAQTAIKQMLGVKDDYDSLVVEVSGTDPVITGKASYRYNCGELYTLSITPPESGTMDIIFTSGATPTVLTLPNTVKMPTWWAGIETNTTYEMCITDGVYCGVMSWAT